MAAAYAMTDEAAERAALGTSRAIVVDGDEVLVPDFTRAMAADLEYLESHRERADPADFYPFLREDTEDWDAFFLKRKVVNRYDESGQVFSAVTTNRVDVFDGRERAELPDVRGGARVKRFDVAALLTDQTLVDLFGITGSTRAAMRNLAAVDTARAALRLRDHVRQFSGYEHAEVVPGAYATSWKAARETLKYHAARFPPVSVAVSAWFIGKKVFMYGDPDDEEHGWRVFGPEGVASLVKMVHAMVSATSPESVAFSLGPELTLLDIDVHDGEQVLCPVRERHAGPHDDLPIGLSPRATAGLSFEQGSRLSALASACEVLAVDGVDCATAVRVSADYVLVNSHVVNEGGSLTCAGQPAFPARLLSRDLWLVKCEGVDVAWPLRAASEGESVVLCYRRHDELCFGPAVRVLSTGAEVLTLAKDECMVPGMSGAAVVALSDFSLLGLYDGVSLQRALVAAFTSDMYTDMCTMAGCDSASRSSAQLDAEDGVVASMKRRGFGKVVSAAMASLVPLYADDTHVGMGFSANGHMYTACDPRAVVLTTGVGEAPVVFGKCAASLYEAKGFALPPPPAVVRAPVHGEEVFVVGRDAEGFFCSVGTGRVSHVGLGARVFSVVGLETGALSFVGGLVLARADAAAVGVYCSSTVDRKGRGCVSCAAVPELGHAGPAVETPEAVLARLFPFLNPAAWGQGVVSAVVTHSSAAGSAVTGPSQAAYAMVGDSAMRTVAWSEMLQAGLPTSGWQGEIQRLQSNAAQAAKCEALGLSEALRVGGGLRVSPGSKVYADLLEAVAGAVYMYEKPETLRVFCGAVGALPGRPGSSSDPGSPDAIRLDALSAVG